MGQQLIDIGAAPNDRSGDTWRNSFDKTNQNFTELYTGFASNTVIINSEADFLNQTASTISLDPNRIYLVNTSYVRTKTIIPGDGSVYIGHNQLGIFDTYIGSGDAFQGTDVDFTIERITLVAATGTYFNFSETVGGTKTFVCNFVRMLGGTFGRFTDYGGANVIESQGINMLDGVKMFGSGGILLSIFKLFFTSTSAAFIALDLGSSVIPNKNIVDLGAIAPPGAIGITGLPNSGNIPVGELAVITRGSFSGGMTPNVNVLPSDLRWEIFGHADISDSRNAADVYLNNGPEPISVAAAGEWYAIGTPLTPGVTWESDTADRMVVGADGVITYIGERDIDISIVAKATLEKVGGGSDILETRLAKNWTGAPADGGLIKSRAQTQNTTPTTVPVDALIPMSTGDNLRMIHSNQTGSSNMNIIISSIQVIGS